MSLLADLEPLSTTWGAYAFVVLLGLLWGSFANVCIYRMPPTDKHPDGLSVVTPGSHCFSCGAAVKWFDNVLMLSYLWLRGRCRACKASFSPRYLFVEALTGALFGLAWWFAMVPTFTEPFSMRLEQFGIDAAFIVVMVVVAFIDLDHKLILHRITYPAIPVFYLLGLLEPGRRWWEGIVGAFVGWGVPWSIGWLYMRLRKREGLGLGDADLLGVIGALLGWQGAMATLFGGSVIGSVVGIGGIAAARLGGRSADDAVTEPVATSASDQTDISDTRADAGAADLAADADDNASDDGDETPSLLRTEIPFGPYSMPRRCSTCLPSRGCS